jgi:flagellar hook-basal body complex protein FliE
MAPIGFTPSASSQVLGLPSDLTPDIAALQAAPTPGPDPGSFSSVIDNMVSGVEQSEANAAAVTRSVLLGDNPNLHQSVIAMQEASLNFGLMVQVRNKVVESYQELMRLPV